MIYYLWARYDICSASQKVEMSLACRGGRQGEWRSVALLNMVDESGDAGGRQGESGCVAHSFIPFCPPVSLTLFSYVLLPVGIFLLHSQVTLSVAVSRGCFPLRSPVVLYALVPLL